MTVLEGIKRKIIRKGCQFCKLDESGNHERDCPTNAKRQICPECGATYHPLVCECEECGCDNIRILRA